MEMSWRFFFCLLISISHESQFHEYFLRYPRFECWEHSIYFQAREGDFSPQKDGTPGSIFNRVSPRISVEAGIQHEHKVAGLYASGAFTITHTDMKTVIRLDSNSQRREMWPGEVYTHVSIEIGAKHIIDCENSIEKKNDRNFVEIFFLILFGACEIFKMGISSKAGKSTVEIFRVNKWPTVRRLFFLFIIFLLLLDPREFRLGVNITVINVALSFIKESGNRVCVRSPDVSLLERGGPITCQLRKFDTNRNSGSKLFQLFHFIAGPFFLNGFPFFLRSNGFSWTAYWEGQGRAWVRPHTNWHSVQLLHFFETWKYFKNLPILRR